jgi:preprotein translocase subunit SecE
VAGKGGVGRNIHCESTEEGELAERKRRGDDAVNDRLDETFDDDAEVDDELADDELDDELDIDDDDEFDDDEDDDDEPVAARSNGRGRGTSLTKTKTKDKLDAKDAKSDTRPGRRGKSTRPGDKKSTKNKSSDRPNIFGRFANFVREVVAELRKVIWPTRKELLTYTAVVVVFVALMLTIVAGLDWIFAKGILWVFGDGEAAAG